MVAITSEIATSTSAIFFRYGIALPGYRVAAFRCNMWSCPVIHRPRYQWRSFEIFTGSRKTAFTSAPPIVWVT